MADGYSMTFLCVLTTYMYLVNFIILGQSRRWSLIFEDFKGGAVEPFYHGHVKTLYSMVPGMSAEVCVKIRDCRGIPCP